MPGDGVRCLEVASKNWRSSTGQVRRTQMQMPSLVHHGGPSEALVTEVQVASIHSASDLLSLEPATVPAKPNESFAEQQRKDTDILELVSYLTSETLPDCPLKAKKIGGKPCMVMLVIVLRVPSAPS